MEGPRSISGRTAASKAPCGKETEAFPRPRVHFLSSCRAASSLGNPAERQRLQFWAQNSGTTQIPTITQTFGADHFSRHLRAQLFTYTVPCRIAGLALVSHHHPRSSNIRDARGPSPSRRAPLTGCPEQEGGIPNPDIRAIGSFTVHQEAHKLAVCNFLQCSLPRHRTNSRLLCKLPRTEASSAKSKSLP